jgi:2-deoxy-D-gluconate 3-dehydrogenase
MNNLFSLESKNAWVTGACYGIGFAIAKAFAQAGASHIIFNARSQEAIDKAYELYHAEGIHNVHGYVCDVTDEVAVKALVEQIHKEVGQIDILVNNAGIIKREDSIDFSVGNWDLVMNVNCRTLFFLSQAAARQFIEQNSGGKIISVASMLSYQGGIRVPSYTASKSAVKGITMTMANEWAKYGINVNAIAPGYMATNNTEALRNDEKRSADILDRIPAGRWGTPDDLMGAAVFLASSASDYVNGFTLAVDGGWLAR